MLPLAGIGICSGTASQSGPPPQYPPPDGPVMVCFGVDALAKNRGIVKSICNLPLPHPPEETRAAMMASELGSLVRLETSFVHGSGCVKMPPTVFEAPSPVLLPDPVPESLPDLAPESLPDLAPESLPDLAPESLPDLAPESLPDPAPEPLPDPAPELLPDPAPELLPDPDPELPPGPDPELLPDPPPELPPDPPPELLFKPPLLEALPPPSSPGCCAELLLEQAPTLTTTQATAAEPMVAREMIVLVWSMGDPPKVNDATC
jgi:hypothetical protein